MGSWVWDLDGRSWNTRTMPVWATREPARGGPIFTGTNAQRERLKRYLLDWFADYVDDRARQNATVDGLARLLERPHLNYQQRFKLMTFVLHNGINPERIYEYLCLTGSLHDIPAHMHIRSLILSWQAETNHHRWYTYSLRWDRWEWLNGEPRFVNARV